MLRGRAARLGKLLVSHSTKSTTEFVACEIGSQRSLSTALLQAGLNKRSEGRGFENSFYQPSPGFAVRGFSDDGSAGDDRDAAVKTFGEENEFAEESTSNQTEVTGGEFFGPDAITGAAETAALAEAWDEAWFLNRGFQYLIQWTHEATGTPWWQSIGICTIASRLAMIPLVVKQMGNMDRMRKAKPEMEALVEWYNQKKELGLAKEYQVEYTTRLAEVWQKYDCNPFKSMLPLFAQAPLFIGFFGALRSMAAAQVPSFTSGGISPPAVLQEWLPTPGLWSDLTIADPYYTLPVLSASIFLVAVRLNAADGMQGQDDKTLSRMKNFMYGIGLVIIPFTAGMPQSVFCYWITSNIYTLAQSAVFKLKGVRSAIGLPPLPQPKQTKAASVQAAVLAAGAAGKPVKTFSAPPNRQTPASPLSSRPTPQDPLPKDGGKPAVFVAPPRKAKPTETTPRGEEKRGPRRKPAGGQKKAGAGSIRPWNS